MAFFFLVWFVDDYYDCLVSRDLGGRRLSPGLEASPTNQPTNQAMKQAAERQEKEEETAENEQNAKVGGEET